MSRSYERVKIIDAECRGPNGRFRTPAIIRPEKGILYNERDVAWVNCEYRQDNGDCKRARINKKCLYPNGTSEEVMAKFF